MFKRFALISALALGLSLSASVSANNEGPDIEVRLINVPIPGGGSVPALGVISHEDSVVVHNVKLNRGNCSVNVLPTVYPLTIKYGEEKKFMIAYQQPQCVVREIVVHVNNKLVTFTVGR